MDLERVTSTGRATTKGRHLSSSRTPVGMSLEGFQQSHGQVLRVTHTSKPPARSSSPSPTCMESSPQSSLSRSRMMRMLLGTIAVMGQNSVKMGVIFTFHQIATQTQVHMQTLAHTHTTTQQGKGGAFSRVAQAQEISRSRRLKCSELTFKSNKN